MNPTGFADQVASVPLPPGWVWAPLAEIARINPALDMRITDEAREVTFVPMAAVDEGFGGVQRPQFRTFGQVKKGYTPFQVHDVIMAKITPCMENGKGGVVRGREDEVFFGSTEFHVLRAQEGVLPEWIGSFLAQERVRRAARLGMKGSAGQLRVPEEFLQRLHLPLPPTAEQSRIVDRIDELFTDLAAGVAALERVKRNLSRYRAAVLHAAVTGRLTEAWRKQHGPSEEPGPKLLERILAERRRQWERRTLAKYEKAGNQPPKNWRDRYPEPSRPKSDGREQLPTGWAWARVDQLTRGDRDSAYGVLVPGEDVPNGVPLIRIGDIRNGGVDVTGLKRIAPSIAAKFQRTFLEGGEMLMSLVGTIGRTAIAPPEAKGANTARAVGVIPLSPLVEARFVEFWFRNPTRITEMTLKSHEVARKTLNLEDVRPTLVALPPRAEQDAIVEAVNEKLSQIDALEAEVDHGLARAGRLRQAILKAAFEGRLVPQDPKDEPANVLLERIRAEAAAAPNGHANGQARRRGRPLAQPGDDGGLRPSTRTARRKVARR